MASEDGSPSSGSEHRDQVNVPQTSSRDKAKSHVESTSLKRGRAESVEPSHPNEPPYVLSANATKKNRLAPSTGQTPSKPLDPDPTPNVDLDTRPKKTAINESDAALDDSEPEGRNIGEVRRKVEKMTYEEGIDEDGGGQEIELPEKGDDRGPNSVTSLSARVDSDNEGEGGGDNGKEEGWEKIDKDEADQEGIDSKTEPDGLKRKAMDRSQSSFVNIEEEAQVKRQKDTPEPQVPADEPAVKEDALGEAATSENDPAQAVKKPQSTFASFSSKASPFAATGAASPFGTAATTGDAQTTSTTMQSAFSSRGFGNYSSSFSPFAMKKTTTLPTASATTWDAIEAESRDGGAGPSSFGDILKQGSKDEDAEEAKVAITEKDVLTGEEDESTTYQNRTKLYVMESDGGWRERGVGTLRLNVRRSDGRGARLVMRAEGVLRLILNVSLYVGMSCLEDGKHVRLTVFEDGVRRLVTFRTGSNKAAAELSGAIHEHIPLESSVPPKTPDPEVVSGDTTVEDAKEEV